MYSGLSGMSSKRPENIMKYGETFMSITSLVVLNGQLKCIMSSKTYFDFILASLIEMNSSNRTILLRNSN